MGEKETGTMGVKEYHLTVHHPTMPHFTWPMTRHPDCTPAAIISDLIESSDLPRADEGYQMMVVDGNRLIMDRSLEANKVPQDAHLQILPKLMGGGKPA